MSRLTVKNLSTSDAVVSDGTGETDLTIIVPAGTTVNEDGLDTQTLENLESQLTQLETAGTIAYRIEEDPAADLRFDRLGANTLPIREKLYKLEYTDLTAANTEQEFVITGVPNPHFVMSAAVQLQTDFAGGGASDLQATVTLGSGLGGTEVCGGVTIMSGTGVKFAAPFSSVSWTWSSADVPIVKVDSPGLASNVNVCTSGELVIHYWYVTPTPVDTL